MSSNEEFQVSLISPAINITHGRCDPFRTGFKCSIDATYDALPGEEVYITLMADIGSTVLVSS